MSAPRISVKNLSKRYPLEAPEKEAGGSWHRPGQWLRLARRLRRSEEAKAETARRREFWALRDVSFELREGERLGIIGRNGAGKSTLLKVLSRLIYPTEGEARIRGRVTALLEVGTGFSELLTGRENVYLNSAIHGLSRAEVDARMNDIIEFSGLAHFVDEPVKHYSSGMRSRLAFAVAAHLDPDILILDEVLAVGDMGFAQKCLNRVEKMTSGGRTLLFVSHSMADVLRFCDRALWLEEGRVVACGPAAEVAEAYSKSVLELKASVTAAELKPPTPSAAPAGGPVVLPLEAPARVEVTRFALMDGHGVTKQVFQRLEPLHAVIEYQVLACDLPILCTVHLHRDGAHVLSTHPATATRHAVGCVVRASVAIPAGLLNTGVYYFSLRLVSPTRPVTRHVSLDMALSCQIVEFFDAEAVFSGDYRGTVRPDLSWAQEQELPEARTA